MQQAQLERPTVLHHFHSYQGLRQVLFPRYAPFPRQRVRLPALLRHSALVVVAREELQRRLPGELALGQQEALLPPFQSAQQHLVAAGQVRALLLKLSWCYHHRC